MKDSLATRALSALYRNHPDTAPADRYGDKARRRAYAQSEKLLAWAAGLPDYRLRDCRNLGAASVAWIRAHQPADQPEGTIRRKVWFSETLALELGASLVDWGDPDEDGFYTPTLMRHAPDEGLGHA